MKKAFLIFMFFALLFSGCAILDALKSARLATDPITGQVGVDQNSIPDPCGVKAETDLMVGIGKTTTELGLITGNPAIAGVGGLMSLAGLIIGGIFLKRKK